MVTGGSGRVGRYVLRQFRQRFETVNADLRQGAEDVEFVETDVLDLEAVRRALDNADAVVHLAGLDYDWGAAPERFIDVNTRGSWHVLQAAEEKGLRKVVLCSSISICGLQEMRPDWQPEFLPIDETHPNKPVYPYGVSKQIVEQMGESFARKGKLEVICIRPMAVLLPETLQQYIDFVDAADRRWLFYYITAEDLARAFEAAVDAQGISFESFYISADDSSRTDATLDWYEKIVGPLPRIANPRLFQLNPRASVFSNAKAKALLGWAPTSDFNRLRQQAASRN